jgi:hypothetical protein
MARVEVVVSLSSCNALAMLFGQEHTVPVVPAVRHEIDDTSAPSNRPAALLRGWLMAGGFDAVCERTRQMAAACECVPTAVLVRGSCTVHERAVAVEMADLMRPALPLTREGRLRLANATAENFARQLRREQQEQMLAIARDIAIAVQQHTSVIAMQGVEGVLELEPAMRYAAVFEETFARCEGGAA